jgi:diguanylate cyclase (GGDEF)-like protein/PAS domain S-box-containing protein
MLALPPGYASPIFPPAGIAVAASFVVGKKSLPWIFVGSLLLNLWVDYSSGKQITAIGTQVAMIIAFASMLQAAAGGWALRRVIGYPALFDNRRDILRFLLLAPVICLTSATLSVSGLWALGFVDSASYLSNWASWWFGDTFGVIVLFPLTMMVIGEPRELWRSRIRTIAYPILVVLITGLAAIYFLQNAAFTTARQSQQDNFDYQTREIVLRVEQRLQIYEQVLRSVRGLYLSSYDVDRTEFHHYVSSLNLEKHYPGIQGVGFSLVIPPEEKAKHVTAIRGEGFPEYDIRPDGKRELYSAIVYIAPYSGRNLRAIGYDMFSEPTRRAAMERARDRSEPALSGKVKLIQENGQDEQAGCLMYLPVYRQGHMHATPEQRRANIVGWVYAAFRMDDLMQGILGEQINNIDLAIYDGTSASPETLMYHSQPRRDSQEPRFQSTQAVKIAGHVWTIRLQSLPLFDAGIDTGKVTVIRLSGLLMMLLLSMLVWQLASGRAQAVKWAQDMTSELRKSEEQLKQAQSIAHVGSWERDFASGSVVCSDEMYRVLELDPARHSLTIDTLMKCVHPDDLAHVSKALSESTHRRAYSLEYRLLFSDGRIKHVHHQGENVYNSLGQVIRCSGTLQDITTRKESEELLQQSYEEIEDLYNHAPCGYHSLDKDGEISRINDTELSWLGYSRDEVMGKKKWDDFISPASKKIFDENYPKLVDRGYLSDLEFDFIRKDGTMFTGLINAVAIYDTDGNFVRSRTTLFDITERKHSEEVIRNLAFYDSLTQLPNRRLLHDRLVQAMATSNRSGLHGALMFLDLDNFKPLNDNYGHAVGDQLLIEVARRINSCVRATDTVSRFGGDEFVVLLSELNADEAESVRQAELVAGKIRMALAEPYLLQAPPEATIQNSVEHHCTCSVGIALFIDHQVSPDELLKRADHAMYEAKESGRNQIRLYRSL